MSCFDTFDISSIDNSIIAFKMQEKVLLDVPIRCICFLLPPNRRPIHPKPAIKDNN